MGRKKAFEPGDSVTTFTGHAGMVVSQEVYTKIKDRLKEGRRPGRYFAPGCCQQPDYVTQVPVLFQDGTYDVMRGMNIKRAAELPEEERAAIERIIEETGA